MFSVAEWVRVFPQWVLDSFISPGENYITGGLPDASLPLF